MIIRQVIFYNKLKLIKNKNLKKIKILKTLVNNNIQKKLKNLIKKLNTFQK